jgi:hypothetical protein
MAVKNSTARAPKVGDYQPGESGNPAGRPPGTKNRLTKRAIEEARTAFGPLVKRVLGHIKAHLKAHKGDKDCATCRHCWDVVLGYYYGKPMQRQEIDYRSETERLLLRLGMEVTEEHVEGVIDLWRERERRAG